MHSLWIDLTDALPLIFHGNPRLYSVIWFTLQVSAVATVVACVIGIPIGTLIAMGHFRGRGVVRLLANCSLALPPALVGAVLFVLLAGHGPLASLELVYTKRVVFIAQAILALPYTVALTVAAIQALPNSLLDQARRLHAGRIALATLALREARVGVFAAIIAALGSTLSEMAAVTIVGGNVYGYNQTLASATLYEVNQANYADALAIGIVLMVLIVVLLGGLSFLQQQTNGPLLRFKALT
jgi:tungstate transport system permease protein